MKLNRTIPFRFKPGSIGLRGKAYSIAEAYHDFTGEDLDRRLAQIEAADAEQLRRFMLEIDVRYKHKTQYEADCEAENIDPDSDKLCDADKIKLAELKLQYHIGDPYVCEVQLAKLKNSNEVDCKLALLAVEHAYEKISDNEFAKQQATVRNEPWIAVVDHQFNPIEGINGLSIEFDWNEQWIRFLRANGYNGVDDGDIVDRWFQDVNRAYADDSFSFVANGPTTRFDNGDGSASYL